MSAVATSPFEYAGPPGLLETVTAALKGVVDPEMAVNIVDLGLVYGVAIDGRDARVRITMTSAACPVAELIIDDVTFSLSETLGAGASVEVDLVWDPPWGPERMSPKARAALWGDD